MTELTKQKEIYICLFCKYSSERKFSRCHKCGQTKLAQKKDSQFHCNKCDYFSIYYFENCPKCFENSKANQLGKKNKLYKLDLKKIKELKEEGIEDIMDLIPINIRFIILILCFYLFFDFSKYMGLIFLTYFKALWLSIVILTLISSYFKIVKGENREVYDYIKKGMPIILGIVLYFIFNKYRYHL